MLSDEIEGVPEMAHSSSRLWGIAASALLLTVVSCHGESTPETVSSQHFLEVSAEKERSAFGVALKGLGENRTSNDVRGFGLLPGGLRGWSRNVSSDVVGDLQDDARRFASLLVSANRDADHTWWFQPGRSTANLLVGSISALLIGGALASDVATFIEGVLESASWRDVHFVAYLLVDLSDQDVISVDVVHSILSSDWELKALVREHHYWRETGTQEWRGTDGVLLSHQEAVEQDQALVAIIEQASLEGWVGARVSEALLASDLPAVTTPSTRGLCLPVRLTKTGAPAIADAIAGLVTVSGER